MKKFMVPEIEVVSFRKDDIIATSTLCECDECYDCHDGKHCPCFDFSFSNM